MTAERTEQWAEDAPTMREVSHVHVEHDPRAWHWFARGPIVAADGGQPEEKKERDVEEERLRDVSHEPRHGEGANRVWDRGDENDEDPE